MFGPPGEAKMLKPMIRKHQSAGAVRSLMIAILLLTSVKASHTMEFRIAHDPAENIQIIIGEGPIIDGDATRLETILPQSGRDRFGNIPLYLNSPGGSVTAAFAVVEVMDKYEFSALVSSNAICASACASIVYICARFHQVVGTGRLGIHTCYIQQTPEGIPEPSAFCNKIIAENAINHGTSYNAVNMWQRAYGADTMAWIGQDVACKYGLCGPPGFDDTLAIPSFDCRTAKQQSEIAICSNKRLARHEASLAKLYFETMKNLPQSEKEEFRAQQRAWLKYRDTCQGSNVVSCLLDRMADRHSEMLRKRR
jgi:uncharacterized protein YecT (DUF1311 family)